LRWLLRCGATQDANNLFRSSSRRIVTLLREPYGADWGDFVVEFSAGSRCLKCSGARSGNTPDEMAERWLRPPSQCSRNYWLKSDSPPGVVVVHGFGAPAGTFVNHPESRCKLLSPVWAQLEKCWPSKLGDWRNRSVEMGGNQPIWFLLMLIWFSQQRRIA